MRTAPLDQPMDSASSTATSMKAIVQKVYGSSPEDVLTFAESAIPVPAGDEVLVRVAAASVDRGTWHVMAGLPYPMRAAGFGISKPKTLNPGRCFAGTVESVGKDATGFNPGDLVYGTCQGSFAQFVAAKTSKLAPMPGTLSFVQAATVPISGVTALQAIRDKAQVQAGDKVLVIGASGGVGSFAVQIARALGAEVTGVCRTSKMDMVRKLGADRVVDYTTGDFLDGKHQYDVIVDTGGNTSLPRLRRALTATGRLVLVGAETDGKWFDALHRTFKAMFVGPFGKQKLLPLMSRENSADLLALNELIDAGKVAPSIDRIYSLSEASAAIRYVQDGRAGGKVAITV